MKVYYITFRSVTAGQRGEQVLHKAGMRVTLLRTPKWMEAQGCGYSLRLWTEDVEPAVALLREKGIAFRRVYIQMPDGALEELEP